MSKRGMDAPLAVQMDRLKKTITRRDQRRDQDRQQRLISMSKDDPYTQANPIKPVGGVSWRSDDAAQAAVLNAAALEGPAEIRCELCQASFRNEAMLRQHEEGPAHKKALAREKAQKEREQWMENPSAASNALQAAAWLGGAEKRTWQSVRPARQAPEAQLPKPKPKPHIDPPAAKRQGPSHADLIAQAKKTEEPLNINGWLPPTLDFSALPAREDAEDDSQSTHSTDQDETETLSQPQDRETEAQGQGEDARQLQGRPAAALESAGEGKAEDASEENPHQSWDGGLGLVDYDDSSDESDSSADAVPQKPVSFF